MTENICQDGVDGSYADTANCNGYTVCVAGKAFRFVCPGQLVFNSRLHFCDFDLHSVCPRRGKPNQTESDEVFGSNLRSGMFDTPV